MNDLGLELIHGLSVFSKEKQGSVPRVGEGSSKVLLLWKNVIGNWSRLIRRSLSCSFMTFSREGSAPRIVSIEFQSRYYSDRIGGRDVNDKGC